MDAATDAAVDQAYGLLTELGGYGWDVDVLPAMAGSALMLTATKGETTIAKSCREVVEAALEVYMRARQHDLYTPAVRLN
jgi:hypothetical protein